MNVATKDRDTLPATACADGEEFYSTFATAQAAWEACERPDWMLEAHARSSCPVPDVYAALAAVWAQDAAAGAASASAAGARYAARYAADAAAAAAQKRQCDKIRGALPVFPGFPAKDA